MSLRGTDSPHYTEGHIASFIQRFGHIMSDAPLPPQTDYPYAARMRVGPATGGFTAPAVPTLLGRLTDRVEGAFDDFSGENSSHSATSQMRFAPAIALALCVLPVINILPVVIVAVIERLRPAPPPGWAIVLLLGPFGGILAAECIVFAFLLVWSSGNFFLRLLVHWALAFALYCCWVTGFLLISAIENWGTQGSLEVVRAGFAALPAVSLGVQAPLWCLRIYGGWRLEDGNGPAVPYSPAQVSIGDILLGTAIVAASLTVWRLMFDKQDTFGKEFWIAWGISFPAFALISILTIAPLMQLIVGMRSVPLAILSLFAYWIVLGLVCTALVFRFVPAQWRELNLFLYLSTLTGFTSVSIPFWLARAAGYRLRIGKSLAP